MENHTAKHFVLQLGSLASLYLSLSFLTLLLFSLINILLPDAADSVWQYESAQGTARLGIAMVIVFFPTYLILTRLVNRSRRKNPKGTYLGLTRWLIYLSLLVGGAVLLGDLVALIMTFLEGEITERFIFKASSLLVVIGSAFTYYLLDARGYWIKNERKSIIFGLASVIVVIAIVIFGFMNIGSPSEVREAKLDQIQVNDLREIQWRVQEHIMTNDGTLPATIEDVYDEIAVPTAPEDRPAYSYEVTEQGFNLCATFSSESRTNDIYSHARPISPSDEIRHVITNPDNWEHGVGEICFERVVK
jgi:hypothetical protein